MWNITFVLHGRCALLGLPSAMWMRECAYSTKLFLIDDAVE
jgi:hypothetical protein